MSEQLSMNLGLAVEMEEKLEARGVYDASRFKSRRPDAYAITVALLKRSAQPKTIVDMFTEQDQRIDIRTVLAVQRELEESGAITPHKERTLWQMRGIMTLGLDALITKAEEGKLTAFDLMLIQDKLTVAEGGVTVRVGHVQEDSVIRSYLEAVRKVPADGLGAAEKLALGARGEREPVGPIYEAEMTPIEATEVIQSPD